MISGYAAVLSETVLLTRKPYRPTHLKSAERTYAKKYRENAKTAESMSVIWGPIASETRPLISHPNAIV